MAQDLRKVNDIESLMTYFSEKLGWAIDPDDYYDIDDITYDFEASDLGLKEEAFAKITSLKQLRPLVDNQRWGIFFVNFESNRFEVSALRKILSGLIPARRNSDHAVWDKKDLLFLCTWGERNKVTIGAAHFEDSEKGLPQIKMISCEPVVEDFTQINIFEQRLSKLAWPSDPTDAEAWHDAWASAFTTRYRQTIQDAHTLTIRLAEEAENIRNRILSTLEIETANGYVHLLYNKFRETLVHDMTEQQFADMYAQTVVYGLFSARCMDETQDDFNAAEAVECIPNTNPFLKSLLQECLGSSNSKSKLSFDELEVGNIVDLLLHTKTDSIIADFNRQTGGGREDPVIHFYEEFLSEYDKTQRVQRGVYYTPQPVVNFIVQAVDDILKEDFGVVDGLASTDKKKIKYLRQSKKRTDGLFRNMVEDEKEVPAIQILDPATGTGTFLRQTILQIYQNFCDARKGQPKDTIQAEWNAYVPEHLLPRINGFELMMAPYAVAHMKLAMVLKDTGYKFDSDERLQVYLTNTLEKPGNSEAQLTLWEDPLAFESVSANAVKKNTGINVVIGNPPYSNSSINRNEWILDLIALYKQGLNEKKLNLDEDSIKFIRYGQFICEQAENSVLAYISNNSFLTGVTHRKMRYELLRTFNKIYIINLHGDSNRLEKCPDGSKDENVFDIQQGVSIHIFIKGKRGSSVPAEVNYIDLFGTQQHKLDVLNKSSLHSLQWKKIEPKAPYYFFDNKDYSGTAVYEQGFSVADLFLEKNTGIQTKNDALTLQDSQSDIENLVRDFATLSPKDLSVKYNIKSGGTWTAEAAKADIMRGDYHIIPILFRPFDVKYTVLTNKSSGFLGRPRFSTMIQMCFDFQNYALLVGRQNKSDTIDSFLVTDLASEMKCAERTIQSYHMPLFIAETDMIHNTIRPKANFATDIVKVIEQHLGLKMDWHQQKVSNGFTAVDVLDYIYAILYSEDYRNQYKNQLKIDFPRIPYPKDADYFFSLVALGRELRELHLMHNRLDEGNIAYVSGENFMVEVPKYKSGSIIINKTGARFTSVPVEIWNMGVGGYQPLQKWLKDRKGHILSANEIEHYIQMIAILIETKRIVSKIKI